MPPLGATPLGKLRHRVQLRRADTNQQADAGMTQTWDTYATVWGEVRSMTANQIMQARQSFSNVATIVTVRFREGIQPNDEVLWGNRRMGIKGVLDPDGQRDWLSLMCEELSNGS